RGPATLVEALQQDGGPALLRDGGLREPPVRDVLPSRVVVREAPEVGRENLRMVVPVAEAVVALELVERSRNAPVLPVPEALVGERVDRAGLPREGRLAGARAPRGDVRRAGGQRVAVVEVSREVAAGLHAVDHRDDVPGHADGAGDLLVARPARGEAARDPVDDRPPRRPDQARLVEQRVLAAKRIRQRGQGLRRSWWS